MEATSLAAGTMETTPLDTSMQDVVTMESTRLAAGTMETTSVQDAGPMATIMVAPRMLSRYVVIKSTYYYGQGYAHSDDAGFVLLGERDVFSTLVKIEAEPARSNYRYVNLRFCNNNKYWARKANDRFIVAESKKPEEDKTKASCTLFEAVKVKDDDFYLTHVQSGGRLLLDSPTMRFYVNEKFGPQQGYLSFVNWESLVKLPKHVAFRGYNGKYLQEILADGYVYLQFSSDDPNAKASGHEVHLMPDGHVRIRSDHWGMFWRYEPNWIWADSVDPAGDGKATLFWPVKINNNTIALRSAGNNRFCKSLTAEGKTHCLNAGVDTITSAARMVVGELVLGRKIYNVRYWMENARIYNETPYAAGTTTAFNNADTPASVAVEINYIDTKTQSFTRSLSLTLGLKVAFEAGVPFITKEGVELSFQMNTTLQWNDTTSTAVSVKATGTVTVPAKTMASVSYVGTRGTCDVPFSYTQQDTSSTDGKITETEQIDGVYTGVNAYNFSFVVDKAIPL